MTRVKPIHFSGPMVRALFDGRKTQTRRVLKPQPPEHFKLVGIYAPGLTAVFDHPLHQSDVTVELPYRPKDLLWVKETLLWNDDDEGDWCYALEWGKREGYRIKPSRFMNKWASRLTLELTAVRVERLQEIGRCDSIAEGILRNPHGNGEHWIDYPEGSSAAGWTDPRDSFRTLWNSLNARRGYGWDDNPWVVALTFTVHRQNVDAILAARPAA